MADNDTEKKDTFSIKGAIGNLKGKKDEALDVMKGVREREEPKKEDDFFGSTDTKAYMKDSHKTEKALKEDADQFMGLAMRMMWERPEARTRMLKVSTTGEPIEAASKVIMMVVGKVGEGMRNSGADIPDELKATATAELINQLSQYQKEMGLPSLGPDEQQAVMANVTQKYFAEEIKAGRVDPDQLSEEAGYSVYEMDEDQRKQTDDSLKRINETAVASQKKYQAQQPGLARQASFLEANQNTPTEEV